MASRTADQPLGSILLCDLTRDPREKRSDGPSKHCFDLPTKDRLYVLGARDQDERKDWLNALAGAVRRSNSFRSKQESKKAAPKANAAAAAHSSSSSTKPGVYNPRKIVVHKLDPRAASPTSSIQTAPSPTAHPAPVSGPPSAQINYSRLPERDDLLKHLAYSGDADALDLAYVPVAAPVTAPNFQPTSGASAVAQRKAYVLPQARSSGGLGDNKAMDLSDAKFATSRPNRRPPLIVASAGQGKGVRSKARRRSTGQF